MIRQKEREIDCGQPRGMCGERRMKIENRR
jgi:hypothetical protein